MEDVEDYRKQGTVFLIDVRSSMHENALDLILNYLVDFMKQKVMHWDNSLIGIIFFGTVGCLGLFVFIVLYEYARQRIPIFFLMFLNTCLYKSLVLRKSWKLW